MGGAWESELHVFLPRCLGTTTEDYWEEMLIARYKYSSLYKVIQRLLSPQSFRGTPLETVGHFTDASALGKGAGLCLLL